MNSDTGTVLLSIAVADLEFSDSFKHTCAGMGFRTLTEVMGTTPEKLLEKEGFSYVWLGELLSFLKAKGMLHLLQPLPGSNAY